jgi:nitroimidazol reductase NimA-like FMN-containing flavoprotein (pyridoxamine 5'-phosphate oxidase superfamily)
MTTLQPEPTSAHNLDGYGAPLIPWERVLERLAGGLTQVPATGGPNRHTVWLATANPNGAPHVMPLGALWVEDAFYFTSGAGTRKSKNLRENPQCTLSVATEPFDLVFEGRATQVRDAATAERIARAFRADGWEATVVEGDASLTAPYSAPSAGPPPWDIYAFKVETVYALGAAEPYGATRFNFSARG